MQWQRSSCPSLHFYLWVKNALGMRVMYTLLRSLTRSSSFREYRSTVISCNINILAFWRAMRYRQGLQFEINMTRKNTGSFRSPYCHLATAGILQLRCHLSLGEQNCWNILLELYWFHYICRRFIGPFFNSILALVIYCCRLRFPQGPEIKLLWPMG